MKHGRVLLVGGLDPFGTPVSDVELFDPTHGTFSVVARLLQGRAYHQTTLLEDGSVLITGGVDHAGNTLDTAERIDPDTWAIVAIPSRMLAQRRHHRAVVLEDGRVLITGGGVGDGQRASAEIFDPRTAQFNHPVALATNRVIHTATRTHDGSVLLYSNGTAEVFQPKHARFERLPYTRPEIRDGHTASATPDAVLIVGGVIPLFDEAVSGAPLLFQDGTVIDIATDETLVGRASHAAVELPDGNVLITGGQTTLETATADVILFESGARRFRQLQRWP